MPARFLGITQWQSLAGLSFSLLLAGPLAQAQAPAWQSAIALGGNTSSVTATAVDADGNAYVTGTFYGTISLGAFSLTSAGATDVFVAKWNRASNAFTWAQRAGGPDAEEANALAVSGGNVYVAGYFSSATATFGSAVLTNARAGTADLFVAKLTDAGTSAAFTWAQRAGGTASDQAWGLAASGSNVYLAGALVSIPADFNGTSLPASPAAGAFVAKLVDAGPSASLAWAQRLGGARADQATAVAVSGAAVYVAGAFAGQTAAFGAFALTNADNTGATTDAFVAKLTDAGTSAGVVWAQRAGGVSTDAATAVAANGTSAYVAGYFASPTAAFGPVALANAGKVDAFVAKLTDAGTGAAFAWAQRAGGADADYAQGLAISGPNVYLAGYYGSASVAFGSVVLTNANGAAGNPDAFVARLTDAGASGDFTWALRAGGGGPDAASSVAVRGLDVYAGGAVVPPANFGVVRLDSPNGSQAGFVAQLTDGAPLATVSPSRLANELLYPNPAHARVTVQLAAGHGPVQAVLTLTDALGRSVRHYAVVVPAAGTAHELNLAGLTPGVYSLQVRTGTATATYRLVVE
ncbi:MAG: T9SS type A sorting domain-containing protein [Janthinobacterium lividum]